MKNDNKIKKWIAFYILITICIILFPYFINRIGIFVRQYHENIISNGSAWLSFLGSYYGSIIGGVLTLGGVFITNSFTRKQINKQINEEKRLSLLPYIRPKIFEFEKELVEKIKDRENIDFAFCSEAFDDSERLKLILEFENFGLGNAVDFCVNNILEIENAFSVNYFIKAGENIKLYVECGIDLIIKHKPYITLTILYKDLLDNKYQQDIFFEFTLVHNDENNKFVIPYIYLRHTTAPILINNKQSNTD